MQTNYRVKITEHDYEYTTYIAWVCASSKNQAMVKGAALAGQAKARREWQRTGREQYPEGLLDPEVTLEKCELDEYWEHREDVVIDEKKGW